MPKWISQKKKNPLSKIKNKTYGLCVCIYILIFFIKNGLSKINKGLQLKKPSNTEGRRKCPINSSDLPIVPPLRCKSIYT